VLLTYTFLHQAPSIHTTLCRPLQKQLKSTKSTQPLCSNTHYNMYLNYHSMQSIWQVLFIF
jgi:hypothetical protein